MEHTFFGIFFLSKDCSGKHISFVLNFPFEGKQKQKVFVQEASKKSLQPESTSTTASRKL